MQRIRYAYDGGIVDVYDLSPHDRKVKGTYTCLSCQNTLVPRLGDVRAWHFAHAIEVDCNYETYLHQAGKALFAVTYKRCMEEGAPFILKRPGSIVCSNPPGVFAHNPCKDVQNKDFPLTRYFNQIDIEKGVDGLIADVLLSSDRHEEKILVEIAVSHHCEPEKIASKNRIIEYTIKEEADLDKLRLPVADTYDPSVTVYNFIMKESRVDLCGGQCDRHVSLFLVHASGKSIRLYLEFSKVDAIVAAPTVIHHQVDKDVGDGDRYKELVRESFFSGIGIKSCYLCRYHGAKTRKALVFCKSLKKEVGTHEAVSCSHYRTFSSLKECEVADKANSDYTSRKPERRIVKKTTGEKYIDHHELTICAYCRHHDRRAGRVYCRLDLVLDEDEKCERFEDDGGNGTR